MCLINYNLHEQFLEEARKFANEKKVHPVVGEESGKKQVTKQEKKKGTKKSWKTALFSFWKLSSSSDKKTKQLPRETSKSCHNTVYAQRRGHVSGPVYGIEGGVAATSGKQWHRLAASGPLTSLFHQKKRKGKMDEIPYVSLDKLNQPEYDAKTYGPVYLVS